ncbi:MAG: Gfo/Idh/MocA family oxidoreductase [Erysipelotrichaceae bacterium]|nr:Gfo/Idh/MocA family oxidoreductase [Erysipelotrichaceae bacterium]
MINIAIIGLGHIAPRVAKGIKCAKNANLYCVASRDINKAKDFKDKYNATVFYDDYQDVYNDTNVDLVYLCTPNHLHYDQIMDCLNNGKNVMCEKPMVSSIEEANELFDYAKSKNLFLMEAEKTVFTDMHLELKEYLKEIGNIYSIRADYSYNISKLDYPKDHWVFDEKYGGCLKDIGVYPICFCNSIANSKVKNVVGSKFINNNYDCDFGAIGIIEYENGIKATIECSWFYDSINRGYAVIFGDKGKIYVPMYWKEDSFTIIYNDNTKNVIKISQESDFEGEIEEASNQIMNNKIESPKMNKEKTIEIMKVIKYLIND